MILILKKNNFKQEIGMDELIKKIKWWNHCKIGNFEVHKNVGIPFIFHQFANKHNKDIIIELLKTEKI